MNKVLKKLKSLLYNRHQSSMFYLCIFLGLIRWIPAEIHFDACMDSAMVHIMNQDYISANTYLLHEFYRDSNNIDAFYMRLCMLATELLDYESYSLNGMLASMYSDSVLEKVNSFLELKTIEKDSYIKYLFFKGNVYMYKGLFLAKTGDWMQGIKNARISIKILKNVLEADSTCYDAILPVGLYNYYVGQNLKWIPFMGLKAKGGLADIERATSVLSPFTYGAKKSLLEIYIEQKYYEKADSLVTTIIKEYPHNTIFLGIKAKVSLLKKEYKAAFLLGKELISLSKKRRPVNWTDLTAGYYIVISSLFSMNQLEHCALTIKEIQNKKIPEKAYAISYVKKHLNQIKSIKQKIQGN